MNTKKQKVMAFVLSLVLVCSSFLEFVVPAQAADTGFAENAVIVSDKAAEYCWTDSEVNLSVVVLNGTDINWTTDRTDGIVITEGEDTEDTLGTAKHLSVAFDETANGNYKITATAGNDSREITLKVRDSLCDIEGVVTTDFTRQFTGNSFEVKAVIDARCEATFAWASADSTKVEIKPLEDKTDKTTYAGSVVKYAQVTIKSEKPENGSCDITATANNIVKTQNIAIYKSATNMKDLQLVYTTYQEEDPNFDLTTYNHMSSDTVYVDMNETTVFSVVVEGTIVNPDVAVGETLMKEDIDDPIALATTDIKKEESSATDSVPKVHSNFYTSKYTKLSDTSYKVETCIEGLKATSIDLPIEIRWGTLSGKVSIHRKLVVLAPAQNMTFTLNVKNEGITTPQRYEIMNTAVGLCKKENESTFKATDFSALHTLKVEKEAEGTFSCTQNAKNIAGDVNAVDIANLNMMTGQTEQLSVIFRSQFAISDKKYISTSTDTPVWKSKDETIVTVTQDGIIKGVKGGFTEVYCYAAPTKTSPRTDIYAVYRVHVTDLILADNINITKSIDGVQQVIDKDTIYTSQKNIQYSAQLVDGDKAANEDVVWESSDPSIFTVNAETGMVNPVSAGTASLIATSVNSGKQAFIPIEVIAAVESIEIEGIRTTYVEGHTYTLGTIINAGADENEELTWTVENADKDDPAVVFIDPNDSEKTELTTFIGRTVQIKIKKYANASAITVKGKYNASAIDNCNITIVASRTATSTYINYDGVDYAGQELTVNKGTNVELHAVLKDENKLDSTDDFQWSIIQDENVVRATNETLLNAKTLTLQPLTKGDVTIELRNLQTNKYLTVTLHVKVPATDISLEESQMKEVMLVPGEEGTAGVTYQLKPVLTPEDTSDVVSYESSDPSIVKVDENGLLTAVKSSETPVTITAKINDTLKATCQVRVAIPVTELKAEDAEGNSVENNGVIRVYKDETTEVKLNCGDATEYIEWASASEKIASVKESNDTYSCTINGNVAGQTTLTATSSISKKKMTFVIKVVNRITSMTLAGSNTIALNATNGYVSVSLPSNSDDVVWTVDNPEMVELTPVRNNNVAKANLTPKKVGKVLITATSADGLCSATKEVEITALKLGSARVNSITSVVYNGTEQKPKLTVTYNNVELVEGEDYTATYSDNVNVGTAKVTLSEGSNGNYAGTKTVNFKIIEKDISGVQVAKINDVSYTGAAVKPEVNMTDFGKKLVENTDYTVSYSNNVKAGTATATVKGRGNYSGKKQISFKITPQNISKVKVAKIADQKYNGKAIAPSLTVTNGTTKLYANRDYKVKFSSNKKPGKAKAVVTGIGNYAGSKTVYFYIAPAQAQLVSVTSTKAKTMKLKWKKDTKATGYEIYYSTKSNFAKKSRKVVTITKSKTTSKTIKKLKSNKTYYVKIRSYKKVGSKKIYSDWSSVMSVQVK
ncbi:MAG: Ig-like domain-containing protein [Lachnospiraceae bacterium]|nr:Ig-like domain-containing protein [Lachnospiraceae bacterium]